MATVAASAESLAELKAEDAKQTDAPVVTDAVAETPAQGDHPKATTADASEDAGVDEQDEAAESLRAVRQSP